MGAENRERNSRKHSLWIHMDSLTNSWSIVVLCFRTCFKQISHRSSSQGRMVIILKTKHSIAFPSLGQLSGIVLISNVNCSF